MYAAPSSYWDNIWNESRSVSVSVLINGTISGSQTLTNNDLISIAYNDLISNDESFEIGNAVMRTFDFSFYDENGIIQNIGLGGATVDVSFSFDDVAIPCGRFFIDDVKRTDKTVTCKSVDAMGTADVPFTSSISAPVSLYVLAQSVANCAGFYLINSSLTNGSTIIENIPSD